MPCHIRCNVPETTVHLTPATVRKHTEIFAFVIEALMEGKFMQLHLPNGTWDTRSRMLCDTGFSAVQSGTRAPYSLVHLHQRFAGTTTSIIKLDASVRACHLSTRFLRNVRDFYQNTRCHIPDDSCLYPARLSISDITKRCTLCSSSMPDRLVVGYDLWRTADSSYCGRA